MTPAMDVRVSLSTKSVGPLKKLSKSLLPPADCTAQKQDLGWCGAGHRRYADVPIWYIMAANIIRCITSTAQSPQVAVYRGIQASQGS